MNGSIGGDSPGELAARRDVQHADPLAVPAVRSGAARRVDPQAAVQEAQPDELPADHERRRLDPQGTRTAATATVARPGGSWRSARAGWGAWRAHAGEMLKSFYPKK